MISIRKFKFYFFLLTRHDLRASITVFFVAIPLCLGISLASGTPVYAGLISGIIGGIFIPLFSRSELSVSGPAAGLTSVCTMAIASLHNNMEMFSLAVSIAGIIQALIGLTGLAGFTRFIPSAAIKGMMSAIGVILISKQIPLLIGYNQPDFWSNELINILTFNHVFSNLSSLYEHTSRSVVVISAATLAALMIWKRWVSSHVPFIPASFIAVLTGMFMVQIIKLYVPASQLSSNQLVDVPSSLQLTGGWIGMHNVIFNAELIRLAFIIAVVATLETLLSIEAIDKLDPYNRVTPQRRELVAQGAGNLLCGLAGGLPVTSVIVRSAANAEAGARTRLSSILHGIWILAAVYLAARFINMIPLASLGVILTRTGYNLIKPAMIVNIWKQGREQFIPFVITIISILLTDLLIGVLIGVAYSVYFIMKHTYRAGFILTERMEGHIPFLRIELALNVSFLNKKQLIELLDKVKPYSVVEVDGSRSVYIDYDILEVFSSFKKKAKSRHIDLQLKGIKEVETLEVH
jgi:MFS superfamily sulfate permease-like transporter